MGQDVSTVMEDGENERMVVEGDDDASGDLSATSRGQGQSRSSASSQRVTTRLTSLRRAARILNEESNRAGKRKVTKPEMGKVT